MNTLSSSFIKKIRKAEKGFAAGAKSDVSFNKDILLFKSDAIKGIFMYITTRCFKVWYWKRTEIWPAGILFHFSFRHKTYIFISYLGERMKNVWMWSSVFIHINSMFMYGHFEIFIWFLFVQSVKLLLRLWSHGYEWKNPFATVSQMFWQRWTECQ